jgi:hypothetical protein
MTKILCYLLWASAGIVRSKELPLIIPAIELAGAWQAKVSLCGKPQVVGVHLQLLTEIVDQRERLRHVDALLTTNNLQGWFSDGRRGFEFDGRRLVLTVTRSKLRPLQEEFELNLKFDEGARQWSGSLTCNGEEQSIVLQRPHDEASTKLRPLMGEWDDRFGAFGFVGCLHAYVQKNDELILWIDRRSGDYSIYGQRHSGGLYGNELRFSTLSPFGNDQGFVGALSADGNRIEGDWSAPLRIPLIFRRVENGACTLTSGH